MALQDNGDSMTEVLFSLRMNIYIKRQDEKLDIHVEYSQAMLRKIHPAMLNIDA